MMATGERAASVPAKPPNNHQQQQADFTIPEPASATCGGCASTEALYIIGATFLIIGATFLCVGCIASVVSVAANDVWPGAVIYTQEFERVLIYG